MRMKVCSEKRPITAMQHLTGPEEGLEKRTNAAIFTPLNRNYMKRVLYPLLLFLISSFVSPESRFVHIHEIDFSGHNDYSVCDTRESSIYWIGYQGEEYWVRYPLGSDKIIKLQRAYKDR